ncbi:MAG: bifunctional riboflavin kinase/FAD synthetase [Planctomycetaceae bacterium]|nr:bifunctional riboflavin kinase/FAD synthetase [Planctomycetaceae bacterium]
MEIIRDLAEMQPALRGGAVTIGNFDGVHQGHARLLTQLTSQARDVGGPAIVLTFDPHPVRILRPELAPPPLTWTSRKAELLSDLGVDATMVYPTDKKLLGLSAEQFFDQIVIQRLGAKALVEGPNFAFGRDRGGSIELLQSLCDAHDVQLQIVTPLLQGNQFVSSSRIREAISVGDVDIALEMLTRPYRVRGMVTHGMNRGATMGFPTANLDGIDTLVPAAGVYAAVAWWQGRPYAAAVNVGGNPTFAEAEHKFEVHLLDFKEMIYGHVLSVDILSRLRGVEAFDNKDALFAQVQQDIVAVRNLSLPWLAGTTNDEQ